MSDLLIVQSIGSNPKDAFLKYMLKEEPIHRAYAERCGADYEYLVGESDPACNPTWNRVRMMLDAFDRGYRKIVWLDADVLVVRPEQNIFAETSDAPLLMTRVESAHVDMPWKYDPVVRALGLCAAHQSPPGDRVCSNPNPRHAGDHSYATDETIWPQWDVYNDGVLIVNDSDHARACLEFAWENRLSPFNPWQVPGMPELSWILDYVFDHPDAVERLDGRWNCMGYEHETPPSEAAILAWHGQPAIERWRNFQTAYEEYYG